jgi:hypothetical protein
MRTEIRRANFLAWVAGVLLALGWCLFAARASAFALLGPYEEWMDSTKGFRMGRDVGGPMDINAEYRWNVPVITYGFDQSFLDYFGSNGVIAVEQAIQSLNDLPPASSLALSNYPTSSVRANHVAGSQGFCDLRSAAFAVLTEQMGLAEPDRNVFVLWRWDSLFLQFQWESDWPGGTIPDDVLMRNYDPETLTPTHSVNGNYFTGEMVIVGPLAPDPWLAFVDPALIDPLGNYLSTITDWITYYTPMIPYDDAQVDLISGWYLTGWTQDDIGGLRYLLSTNNINLERLLPGVHGIGTTTNGWVDLALRPGVDKVTLIRQEFGPLGQPVPLTNQFTDTYVTNGAIMRQQLERIIVQPDILFSVADSGADSPFPAALLRSGTSNWWNSATVSSNGAAGPGVIQPPVRIAFNKLGTVVQTDEGAPQSGYTVSRGSRWGSFTSETNPVVAYPANNLPAVMNELPVHLWLLNNLDGSTAGRFTWQAPVSFGQGALLQTSTNLTDWATLGAVTNHGGAVTWRHYLSLPQRFFRVVPQ